MGYNGVILYIDEIHHFTKRIQQSLLEFIENGQITLIAVLRRIHIFIYLKLF